MNEAEHQAIQREKSNAEYTRWEAEHKVAAQARKRNRKTKPHHPAKS